MPNAQSNALSISRRLILGGGLAAAVTAVVAACTPTSAASPARSKGGSGGTGSSSPTLTGVAFADEEFDGQFVRVLDTIPYGGADFGEAFIAAKTIPGGDVDAWYDKWTGLGDRISRQAEASRAAGHEVSAREGFLRAVTYYRTAGIFSYRIPVDDRLLNANERQRDAFRRAAELSPWSIERVTIPYEGTTLPGWFATPGGAGPVPTLILIGGYDGTKEEMYFAGGEAALRRGYAVLCVDGPGQAEALLEQKLYFRPDWEAVVTPQVDWLLQRPEVDPARISAMGRSWGGYLAPRAATAEHRLAAVIADAPQYSPGTNASMLLPEEYRAEAYTGDEKTLNGVLRAEMDAVPSLAFVFNRGMLTHGFDTPLDYLRETKPYSLEGIAGSITCPVLLTYGENDPRNADARKLYDALAAPKEIIEFTNAEGGGEHDEAGAGALFSQRVFDWLDTTLGN